MKLSIEKKKELVSLYYNGIPVSEICQEYQISRSTFYTWIRTYRPIESQNSSRIVTPKDFDSLRRHCEKQEQIIAVLKSIPCIANATTQEKLAALEPLYGQFNVHALCEALDVPRGTNGITVSKQNIEKNYEKRFKISLMRTDKYLDVKRSALYFTSAATRQVQHWCGNSCMR